MYRAGIEWILGFRLRGATLHLDPCIPRAWRGFEIAFRYHSARYEITVENPRGVSRGIAQIEVDGRIARVRQREPSVDRGRRDASGARHPGVTDRSGDFDCPARVAGPVSDGPSGCDGSQLTAGVPGTKRHSAEFVAWSRARRTIQSRHSVPRSPRRSLVARSDIRPCGGSGVGACAALLLLLLQSGRMRAVLFRRLGARFFAGIRGLLSVSRRFRWSGRPRRGQLDRNARDPAGRRFARPPLRPQPSRRPATRPLMGAWRASSGLPSSQTGKGMSISACVPALFATTASGDSPGGRSVEAGRGRPCTPSTCIRT